MSDQEGLSEEDQDQLIRHGIVMEQLLHSQRFVRFFRINYDLHRLLDEDEKVERWQVIEVPPEIAAERQREMLKEAGKEAPSIVAPTPTEIAQVGK